MNPHTKPSANVRSPRPVRNSPVGNADELKSLLERVESNPAKVEFPRDTWGFTSALKKVALDAASNVKGQEDKQTLLLAVLDVLKAHVIARYSVDIEFRKSLDKQKSELKQGRLQRTRIFGSAVPKPAQPLKQEPIL